MSRADVERLHGQGLSASEIAQTLALTKSTVCYHLRRLGVRPDPRYGRRYDWSEVRTHYEAGHSLSECRARFGFSGSAWADAVARGDIVLRSGREELELTVRSGRILSRGSLKRALVREGLKDGCCERCGIREWRARELSITLHHVNGDCLDDRLENLQLLCPNCHSQTENYGGRNLTGRGPRRAAPVAPAH
jgi:hypothetical protein